MGMPGGAGAGADADRLVAEGLGLHQAGRLPDAATLYIRALERMPRHARASQLLGTLLLQQGRHADAVPRLEAAAELDPRNANTWSNLGVALNGAGRPDAALAALDRAIRVEPRFEQAHSNRGMVLKALRRFDAAAESYRRAIALKPAEPGFHHNLGNVLVETGDLAAAEAAYREALRLRPAYPAAAQGLARVLVDTGRADRALAELDIALQRTPSSAVLHHEHGRVLQAERRLLEAAAAYRRAIALDPRHGEARFHLAHLLGSGHPEGELRDATSLFHDEVAPVEARIYSGFAVARILADLGRHDASIGAYDAVNAMLRAARPFEIAAYLAECDARYARHAQLPIAAAPAGPAGPIFVVGLPRAGKTTLEVILAAHPDIVPLGEQAAFPQAVARHALPPAPSAADQESVAAIGARYLSAIAGRARPGQSTIDTMPANIANVGLILASLPGARVLWCLRDPAEHAIALYEKYLPQQGYDFASDLDDALRVVEASAVLAARWAAAWPRRVHLVRLSPTAALGTMDREAICRFLGLESAGHLPDSARSEPVLHDAGTATLSAQMAAWRRLHPELWCVRGGNPQALTGVYGG
jgi:tetratricopeptide (TPR) repeat protein